MRPRNILPRYFQGLKALKANPEGLTAVELMPEMDNIAKRNVLKYVTMWRERNEVYISGWRRADVEKSGDWIPVYSIKPFPEKKDVKKPRKLTDAEKQAAYRDRHRAAINAKRRMRRAIALGKTISPFAYLNARSGLT